MAQPAPSNAPAPGRTLRGPESHPTATTLFAALTALVLLVLFGAQIRSDQRAARNSLEERYVQRTTLAQQFVDDYTADLLASIRRHAAVALSGPHPSSEAFEQVVKELRGTSAVLVGADGQLLQSEPPSSGPDAGMASRFPLSDALAGNADTVALVGKRRGTRPSEVGFVVHFDSTEGRRVLAIGIATSDTSLRSFFRNLSPIAGQRSFLIDASGTIIAANDETAAATLSEALPDLDEAVREHRTGTADVGGEERFFTTRTLSSAPWRVVSSVPSVALYAPLDETRWTPWLLFGSFTLGAVLGLALLRRVLRERAAAAHHALFDNLTGIANRRQLELVLAEARHRGGSWGVLMLDIDHFKSVNDGFGHTTGDDVLREVADRLRTSSRGQDVVGRWGGEEFLVIIREADDDLSAALAERLRGAVAAIEGLASGPVTVSIGCATTESTGTDDLVEQADAALYLAKQRGRNQVATAARPDTAVDEPVEGPAPAVS